ncbi:MAG: AAA family ATPase [Aeromonadaceae bacterium]|nr:AAA family ATPase [Aeromonadaceae bacterium]
MIVLVGGEKGGSGKSCLAQNLAVYFKTNYPGEVLLVDCDPQRTTSDWIQERKDNNKLTPINCVQLYGNIREDLLSLKNRYEFVVVDCGGQDNRALRSTMSVASHALIPLRPKRRDLKTLPHMEDIISTCKMVNPTLKAAVVMTQCPSLPNQVRRILEAKEVCQSFCVDVLESIIYSRNVYDDSEEKGLSVMEIEPDGKAAEEIRGIAKEFLQL